MKNKKTNILFVCKYNRFRSKIAEAYFNKINKNKLVSVKSAGIIRGNPVSKDIIAVAKALGIVVKGNPKTISSKVLSKTDLIVIVADDDVPHSFFTHEGKYIQKVIHWKIKDSRSDNKTLVTSIIKQIKYNVEILVNQLR
ncbi:MAG TPA: hypothetical protein VJH92_05565 [Candidatus Nanoarchaeia archaeon]|nr:hypothetical protein [Candidatus Nanoarchaeia archaeon]